LTYPELAEQQARRHPGNSIDGLGISAFRALPAMPDTHLS